MTSESSFMVQSEDPVAYLATETKSNHDQNASSPTCGEDAIINQAVMILGRRLGTPGQALSCPNDVKKYLTLKMAEQEREVFAALFLDNRHRVISYDELFYGTVDGASVHPREVVKAALAHNAAAAILSHNHPSGVAEPSQADQNITRRLQEALALVEVRVLDHVIVGGTSTVSFAERGLI